MRRRSSSRSPTRARSRWPRPRRVAAAAVGFSVLGCLLPAASLPDSTTVGASVGSTLAISIGADGVPKTVHGRPGAATASLTGTVTSTEVPTQLEVHWSTAIGSPADAPVIRTYDAPVANSPFSVTLTSGFPPGAEAPLGRHATSVVVVLGEAGA